MVTAPSVRSSTLVRGHAQVQRLRRRTGGRPRRYRGRDGHPVALPPLPAPPLQRAEGAGPRRARPAYVGREGREGQAYLFSGPRGTGKTTSARILAKVLNCENPRDGEPCCECESCLAVERGTSYDVHELDAASNNGVDAIRDLIEKASLGTPGRHKVYILDEVHMLSQGGRGGAAEDAGGAAAARRVRAATTDPQKMTDTIRSRTQHLQFHLLPADTLAEHVRWVAADAGLDLSDAALEQALTHGGGSARDTLSALELLATTGGEGRDVVARRVRRGVIDRDSGRALTVVAHAISSGIDPRTLTEELIASLRNGFLSLMAPELVQLPSNRLDALAAQAQQLGAAALVRASSGSGRRWPTCATPPTRGSWSRSPRCSSPPTARRRHRVVARRGSNGSSVRSPLVPPRRRRDGSPPLPRPGDRPGGARWPARAPPTLLPERARPQTTPPRADPPAAAADASARRSPLRTDVPMPAGSPVDRPAPSTRSLPAMPAGRRRRSPPTCGRTRSARRCRAWRGRSTRRPTFVSSTDSTLSCRCRTRRIAASASNSARPSRRRSRRSSARRSSIELARRRRRRLVAMPAAPRAPRRGGTGGRCDPQPARSSNPSSDRRRWQRRHRDAVPCDRRRRGNVARPRRLPVERRRRSPPDDDGRRCRPTRCPMTTRSTSTS